MVDKENVENLCKETFVSYVESYAPAPLKGKVRNSIDNYIYPFFTYFGIFCFISIIIYYKFLK